MATQSYMVQNIGENRGAPRIYLETQMLSVAGFIPGAAYSRESKDEKVVLKLDPDGQFRVSKKERGGVTVPVIDLNSKQALGVLDGLKAVRLVIQDGLICAMATASEANAKRRLARLRDNLSKGQLVSASLSHGGGILDHAAHAGLSDAGVESELGFANEIDGDLLEH